MFVFFVLVSLSVFLVAGFPFGYVKRIAENHNFDDFENYLPKFDDLPRYQYSSANELDDNILMKYKTVHDKGEKKTINIDALTEESSYTTGIPEIDTYTINKEDNAESTIISEENSTSVDNLYQLETSFELTSELNETTRLARQESNDTRSDPEFESQEEGSSEENGNMITGLLSAFLGGFSRPDGSIDLDAIIGILGSLSTQNDDGTYDFQGLTDLVRGFFGGGGDEGGGSDLGAFVGGLLGALLKGVANPPGAKGAGIFTGKVVAGVLPALSGPAPPAEDMNTNNSPPQGLDSGGFLSGLLKTILSSSGGGNGQGEGGASSFNFFKIIFSTITSLFTSSSKSD